MHTTFSLVFAWANNHDEGCIWIDGHGWLSIQRRAAKYLEDLKTTYDVTEWEAGASRFVDAVRNQQRWCIDPAETFETIVPEFARRAAA